MKSYKELYLEVPLLIKLANIGYGRFETVVFLRYNTVTYKNKDEHIIRLILKDIKRSLYAILEVLINLALLTL